MRPGKFKPLLLFVLALVWLEAAVAVSLPREKPGQSRTGYSDDLFRAYKNIEAETSPVQLEIGSLPLVKKDRQGRVWKAWEEWGNSQSQIRLGQIQAGRLISPQTVGRQAGFNYSPDFFFDQAHSPWVIWVNYFKQEHRIFVQDTSSRRTWLLSSKSHGTLASPKIILDQNNSVWTFWNETSDRTGKIYYRVFNHREWSPLKVVPQGNDFPPLNPDVAIDRRGTLWVAWSRYDGQDYEIYLSCFDGQGWPKETRITDNGVNDVFPAIGLGPEDKPLLSWTQSSGLGNQICFKSFEGGAAGQEIKISPATGAMPVSRIFREGEKIGIIWKSAVGIKAKEFSSNLPAGVDAPLLPTQSPHPLYNPSFDENKYVGLGDSITFGFIDRLPTPELGYIPRLDAILNQNFGPSQMINEGIPGETTVGGLGRIDSVISTHLARYLLIMEGTNDAITGGLSKETAAFNLSEMVRKCLEAGVFPAIATIIPRRDWLWAYDIVREKHLYIVEKIHEIAASYPVPLVDQYELFLDYPSSDGGLLSLLSNDLLHPSEKGYQFMAASWFGELKNFPFPPVDIELRGRSSTDALSSPQKCPSARFTKRNFTIPYLTSGNLLTWKHNPKIFDRTRIKGYKIYRKKPEVPVGAFRLRAFVPEMLRFFDSGTNILDGFVYIIATVRDDGIEGPASSPTDK
jgi:lysophospholipase L1-like esterase